MTTKSDDFIAGTLWPGMIVQPRPDCVLQVWTKLRLTVGVTRDIMATAAELYDMANALKVQGKLTEAVAKLEEAVGINPDHSLTHSALAILHQRLGNTDKAIQHAIRVTELEPTDQFAYTQLSVIYQRCGRLEDAEAVMFKAREITGKR